MSVLSRFVKCKGSTTSSAWRPSKFWKGWVSSSSNWSAAGPKAENEGLGQPWRSKKKGWEFVETKLRSHPHTLYMAGRRHAMARKHPYMPQYCTTKSDHEPCHCWRFYALHVLKRRMRHFYQNFLSLVYSSKGKKRHKCYSMVSLQAWSFDWFICVRQETDGMTHVTLNLALNTTAQSIQAALQTGSNHNKSVRICTVARRFFLNSKSIWKTITEESVNFYTPQQSLFQSQHSMFSSVQPINRWPYCHSFLDTSMRSTREAQRRTGPLINEPIQNLAPVWVRGASIAAYGLPLAEGCLLALLQHKQAR